MRSSRAALNQSASETLNMNAELKVGVPPEGGTGVLRPWGHAQGAGATSKRIATELKYGFGLES